VVVIKRINGQLANRLHFLSYFIANSKAYNYSLIVTCFPEYHDLFTLAGDDSLTVTFTRPGIKQKAINKILNKLHALALKFRIKLPGIIFHSIAENDLRLSQYDINQPGFVKLAQHQVVIPEGWVYRDYINFKKYLPQIKNLFSPKQEFRDAIKHEVDRARSMGDMLIGVHIRRGDYKDFNGGKWFYSNEVYINKMQEAERLFAGKQCVFIICSQEKLDTNEFSGFKTVIAERPAIVDLYLLAECNYIFGPPSTFTGWASLYNTVPAYYMESAGEKITIDSFKEFFD
jgi:Glycosyl transferase family 11